jgi:dihydrofolate reductase
MRITEIPKIVFTKTLANLKWENTTLATGEISEEINQLKKKQGGDIMVYGGAGFVSSLIEKGLVDEYHLLVNPAALGNGLPIFKSLKNKLEFTLVECRPFSIGQVLLYYKPKH